MYFGGSHLVYIIAFFFGKCKGKAYFPEKVISRRRLFLDKSAAVRYNGATELVGE